MSVHALQNLRAHAQPPSRIPDIDATLHRPGCCGVPENVRRDIPIDAGRHHRRLERLAHRSNWLACLRPSRPDQRHPVKVGASRAPASRLAAMTGCRRPGRGLRSAPQPFQRGPSSRWGNPAEFGTHPEMSVEAACAVEGTACCACAASGKAATQAIIAMKRRLRIGPYLCWVSLQLRTFKEEIQAAECLPWVNRVTLTLRRSLPVFLCKRTISEVAGMSQRCH